MGLTGLVNILLSLVCIGLSWWALQIVKIDSFVKTTNSTQTKALQILLSIALGHSVAKFFMDYLGWSLLLKQLV